jgi:hypothetical protein
MIWLRKHDPELFAERARASPVQKGQKTFDKLILTSFTLCGIALMVVPGLDERWGRAAPQVRNDTLRQVCAVVDDDTVVALAAALRARGVDARKLVLSLAQRGFAREAIELTDEPWIHEVRAVRDAIDIAQLAPWRDHILGELHRQLGEEERNSVSLLTTAEVGIELMAADDRAAIVEELFRMYSRDAEAGWYDELDYPYGEIDPTLRIAGTDASRPSGCAWGTGRGWPTWEPSFTSW